MKESLEELKMFKNTFSINNSNISTVYFTMMKDQCQLVLGLKIVIVYKNNENTVSPC